MLSLNNINPAKEDTGQKISQYRSSETIVVEVQIRLGLKNHKATIAEGRTEILWTRQSISSDRQFWAIIMFNCPTLLKAHLPLSVLSCFSIKKVQYSLYRDLSL